MYVLELPLYKTEHNQIRQKTGNVFLNLIAFMEIQQKTEEWLQLNYNM